MKAIVCVLFAVFTSSTDEDLEHRFRAEYPAALAAQDLAASQVTYRGRSSLRFFSGYEEFYTRLTVARDGERVAVAREECLVRQTDKSAMKPASSQVDFRSPDLHFQLIKRPKESSYVIVRHGVKYVGDDAIFQAASNLLTRAYAYPQTATLLEWMESPAFHLVGFRRVQVGDESLVRLEFTNRRDSGETFEGWYDFDPDHNWVLRRAMLRQTANPKDPEDLSTFEKAIEYRLVDPSHYLPKRIEQSTHLVKSNLLQRDLVEYDEIIVGPPDESLFRLSGYGLPDVPLRPLTAASGPSLLGNAWFWGSLVAGALSLAALVFSRSRRASASARN